MSAKVRTQSKNTGFLFGLGAIAVAGLGFIGWKMMQPPAPVALVLSSVADSAMAAKARGYTIGSPTAKVEIMEFADFECPGCGSFAMITEPDVRKNLVATGLVRYTFYDFPLLNVHQNTVAASMSAACADDQGKFWEMHDRIFEGQFEWSGQATGNPRGVISTYAQKLGLDMKKWDACMDASAHAERIKGNYALGVIKQVGVTPTFFINGQMLRGPSNYDDIKAAVDAANASAPPVPVAAPVPAKN